MADPARLTRADVAAAMMLTLTRNLAMAVPSLFSNHLFIARRERNLLAGRFEFSAPGRPQVRVTSPYGQCRRIVAGLWNAKPTVGLLRQCRAHANYRQREALTTRSARLIFLHRYIQKDCQSCRSGCVGAEIVDPIALKGSSDERHHERNGR